MLTVNVNSVVPHISYYFDQQSVYMDEEFHLYSFKLPIYFLGAFRIWVTEASDISFNDIEIYLDRKKSIKFQKEKLSVDESGIINFPLMLMPL